MALTATDCHKSVTVDDKSVTISGQWLSGGNQRPSGGNYRSLPTVDGAQDAIEDRVAPTRAHLRLKVNWRSIGGQLEVNWRSIGGQSEVNWRSIRGQLEVNWRSIRGQSEVNHRSIGGQSEVNQRSIRGQSEVIGALSRARRLVRTVLILARFHADGDEPNESISTVEIRRDGDTDGETDGDSVRSGSSAARADIRLSGMGEADEEGTGEGEPKGTAILGTGACRRG